MGPSLPRRLGGSNKANEKSPKDITNKLVIRPVNLKQSKMRPKLTSGLKSVEKGVKRINQMWVDEDIIELVAPQAHLASTSRPIDLRVNGQTRTRPPDPSDPSHLNATSLNPKSDLGTHEDGGAMEQSRASTGSPSGGVDV